MSLLLSSLDGRITLKGLLGTGGMGEVHRAWDAGLERPVAVKFVRSSDLKEADRLLLEARLQARVEHPNVVRVHDTGTLEGRPCILLQLVEGRTFADLHASDDWRTKVVLAAQAARGLGAAHRMGLIHRDVKPANILVEDTEEGPQARLSDFGLARDEEGGLTRSGLMMGTVDFMAPEQVTGVAPVDFRADIYGLGATLYAVLTGHPPFRTTPGPTASAPSTRDLRAATPEGDLHPGDLLRRVLEEEPRSLRAQVPGLPKDLAIIIAKAMEKDPSRRYATAEALAEDLERASRGEPIQATRVGLLDQVNRWSRRNRMTARVLAGAVALLLLGLGYTLVASRRAGLIALENARLGAEAAAMESVLKREYLLPAHDLRPVIQAIRRKMAVLAVDGTRAEAPRAYALGRGHQLLEEWPEARVQLERARSLGFRTQESELVYGLVLAELYDQGLKQARTIPDPGIRQARLEALREELLKPSVAAIRAQAAAMPERTHTLLGQVDLLEGRLEEALQHAKDAQASPVEQAEGLFLEARILVEKRELLYVKHAHQEAMGALQAAARALEAARLIARSDPRVAEALVQCSLLMASHQRSLGAPTAETLAQARTWFEEAKALHGDEGRLAVIEAVLWQRLSMSKKDVGQSGVQEDTAALELLRQAVIRYPLQTDLYRHLANAYYSYCYAKVAAGEDPGNSFELGYQAVESALKLSPQDWRLPYTGALLAQPESLYLNTRGLDARAAAQRGIQYAERAIRLGAAANAKGIRADCLVELAKAQYGAGEDPTGTLQRIMEDNAQGVSLAPTDQIMRINATAAAIQAAQLVRNLKGDIRPYLEKAAQWNEGSQPKYIEAQRNRLDLRLLQVQAGPREGQLEACDRLIQDCQSVEKQFHTPLPFQSGSAWRLKARLQLQAGVDPSAAFAEARKQFLGMEKENPSNVQAYAETAFTCLEEARWRLARGPASPRPLEAARAALDRFRKVQADQTLLFALEAALLRLEAGLAPADQRAPILEQASGLWNRALTRNRHLGIHPEFAGLHLGS
ncbi:serine/threonine-protein kinase [Geothrix sp.]|jgi:serine/threonine-protein kinase|uniref:serine/threonine-protein kinase n=1 Tax=Geothrix sp. TaxID=1962974 RepID=UPI0025C31B9E|nr:serine/threonine-protein kinase [Geothrix sp.]